MGTGHSSNHVSYTAFISYEIDTGKEMAERFCAYLQRRHLPKRLRDLSHEKDAIGEIYLNIYRHKGKSWPEALVEGLQNSEYLILISGKPKSLLRDNPDRPDYYYLDAAIKLFLGFEIDFSSTTLPEVTLTKEEINQIQNSEEKLSKLRKCVIPFVIDDDLGDNLSWAERLPLNLRPFINDIDIYRTSYISNKDMLPAVAAFSMFGIDKKACTYVDLYNADFYDGPLSDYPYAASIECCPQDRGSRKTAEKLFNYLDGFSIPFWYRKKVKNVEKDINSVHLNMQSLAPIGTFKYLIVVPGSDADAEMRQLNARIKSFLGFEVGETAGAEILTDAECEEILQNPVKKELLTQHMFCFTGGRWIKKYKLPINIEKLKNNVYIVSEQSMIASLITRFSHASLSTYNTVKFYIIVALSWALLYYGWSLYVKYVPQCLYFKGYDTTTIDKRGPLDEADISKRYQSIKATYRDKKLVKIEKIQSNGKPANTDLYPWDGIIPIEATFEYHEDDKDFSRILFKYSHDKVADIWDLSQFGKIRFFRQDGTIFKGEAMSIEELIDGAKPGGLIRYNPDIFKLETAISHCDIDVKYGAIVNMFFMNNRHLSVTNADGAAGFAFDYLQDEKQKISILTGIYLIDEYGHRMANKAGVCGLKFDYEDDNISKIQCVDVQGNAVLSRKGVSSIRLLWSNDNLTEMSYFGLDGKRVLSDDGVHLQRFSYNDKGRLERCSYYDEHGHAIHAPQGNYFQKVYKTDRGVRNTMYYDETGQFINGPDGYAREEEKLDSGGRVIQRSFYDKNNKLTKCSENYAFSTYCYNKDGVLISIAFYDENHKPACLIGKEVHRQEIEYQKLSDGRIIARLNYYDITNRLMNSANTPASIESIIDNKHREIRKSFFDCEGKPWLQGGVYHVVEFQYDKVGGWTEIFYNPFGERVRTAWGYSAVRVSLKEDGFYEERYLDENGRACAHIDGYFIKKYRDIWESREVMEFYFDQHGRSCKSIRSGSYGLVVKFSNTELLQEERYLNEHGQLAISDHGVARMQYIHEPSERKTRVLDTEGNPAMYKGNWHLRVEKWDEQNRHVETLYYGIDDTPCMDSRQVHRVRYRYEGNNKESQVEYFDIEGKEVYVEKEFSTDKP